jgi:excisionase family DNA binding protein
MAHEFLTTSEVAYYLRLKERTIYELVRTRQIPCARITGKLLFPKHMIDLWVMRQTEFEGVVPGASPPVAAGSHDPLLEWALRESGSGLALLSGGSRDGLHRLAAGQAVVAGLHILDAAGGEYNVAEVRAMSGLADVVLIEWARREQGIVVAPGNPKAIRGIADLGKKGIRVARRQEGAGAQILLDSLLARAGKALKDLHLVEPSALTETDLAAAVLDGAADCGIAVRAVAKRFSLGFVPLHVERFDLAVRRRDYFEPPVQKLLAFAGTAAFAAQAAALEGYDIGALGRVVYNP